MIAYNVSYFIRLGGKMYAFFSPPSMSRDRHSLPREGTHRCRVNTYVGCERILWFPRPLKNFARTKGRAQKKPLFGESRSSRLFYASPPPHLPARHRCRLIRKCCSRIFFSIYGPSPEKRALSTLLQKNRFASAAQNNRLYSS